ncbi:MAG: hypothetical protein QG622_1711 [Actinomycetota bacterium]|nr:hypothetical protein [Actinomycetota bacterium]
MTMSNTVTTPGALVVTEIERKFDVRAGFRLPDLAGIEGVARVSEPREHDLDATYFDTEDLRLATNKVTLRRRTGGDDAGWHLKLPRTDGERDEVRLPLGRAVTAVPPALRTPVTVHLRGARLGPVVRLATSRIVHHLLDDEGAPLVEIAQDTVVASRPGPAARSETVEEWTELEVELVGGDRPLLDAVCARLVAAGAEPSRSPSKLARALGDRLPSRAAGRPVRPDGIGKNSAGAVLLRHLAEQVSRLKSYDPAVRADEDDAVHQMRVATRRLRGALATFRPLLDREVTDPVRQELRWLGGALGDARDAEVVRDHLRGLVDDQPSGLVLGPVVERITTSLDARYRTAHAKALRGLGSPRYFALLDSLDALVAAPPFAPDAAGRADAVLPRLVARTFTRTRDLVEQAGKEQDPHRHDELLHEIRKAAKRARYAGESVAPFCGRPARTWARRMEAVQEALGAHQDTVVIREELLALTAQAHDAGENAFTYGRLHHLEEMRAADTEGLFGEAWAEATRKRLHRWLLG